jgi:integrase
VRQRGAKLSLRATLPPKPGSGKSDWHQQDISLGIYANIAGFQRAEAEAKLLGGRIASASFDWSQYLECSTQNSFSCGYWIDRYREDYFAQRGDDPTKQQTWKEHYERYFNLLPSNENLSPEILITAVASTPANTWTRRTVCQKLSQLAQFAGVKIDLKKYQGDYSSSKQIIRQLPTEEEIVAARDAISHPEWQWVFGAIAAFGLRPHESFHAEISPTYPHICTIADGKTGERIAYPLPLLWVTQWQLWENKKPSKVKIEGVTDRDLGSRVYKALKRYGVDFKLYNLRHSYAIRAATKYRVPIAVAAKWMGHSPTVHLREYNRHITEVDHLEIFERFTQGS